MYPSDSPKVMAIGAGKQLKATGIIKKVFPNKPDPYGFLLLLTPLEIRGQEASFFCCDLKVPDEEREHLRVGMQLEFKVIDKPVDNMKSIVDFKAIELLPLTPSLYQAAVVRAPDQSGNLLRVAVDLTLEQVKISTASCLSLEQYKHLAVGAPCVIQLTWKEMVAATKEKRTLEGDIVSACRLPIPPTYLQAGATDTAAEENVASSEDSPPETPEHGRRGAKSTPKKPKEPQVRSLPSSHPKSPRASRPLNPYEFEYFCESKRFKQDTLCCSGACCQDPGFEAPKIPQFPLPTFNAPCPCAGCLMMSQTYAMMSPGCLSCYPADHGIDVNAPSWPDVDGC